MTFTSTASILPAGMTAHRLQTSLLALLASAAAFNLPAAAQPAPCPPSPPEREIAITGGPGEPHAVLYAAPDVPLVVIFDAPLRKDAAVAVPGADVRAHPFVANALLITPSKSLTGQSPIPVLVPMAEGAVSLTLTFSRAQRDAAVRIVHRAISARPGATQGELEEALSFANRNTLDPLRCAKADGSAVPREVGQAAGIAEHVQVCGGGALSYLEVKTGADCRAAAARLTRGDESAEVLLLRPAAARSEWIVPRWLVVARAPRGDGRGFMLELLAGDGAVCESSPVDLKP